MTEVDELKRSLNRQKRLLDGAVKMLSNSGINTNNKSQTQREIANCKDSIRQLQLKIQLKNMLDNKRMAQTNSRSQIDDILDIEIDGGLVLDSIERLKFCINPIEQINVTNQLISKLENSKSCLLEEDSRKSVEQLFKSEFSQVKACALRILTFTQLTKELIEVVKFNIIKALKNFNGIEFNECLRFFRVVIEKYGFEILSEDIIKQIVKTSDSCINNSSSVEIIKIIDLIELCCEICLINPEIGFQYKFLKLTIQALIDPPYLTSTNNISTRDIKTIPLPLVLKYIEDKELYLLLEKENFIPLLISNMIDANLNANFQHNHLALQRRMIHIGDIICKIIKSEQGLNLFLDDDYKFFRMLINGGLYNESSIVKNSVIGIISNGLKIRKLTIGWGQDNYDEIFSWEKLILSNKNLNEIAKVKFNGRSCPSIENDYVVKLIKKMLKACEECQINSVLVDIYGSLNDHEKKFKKRIILLISEITYLRSKLLEKDEMGLIKIDFKINNLIEKELKRHLKLDEKNAEILKSNDEEDNSISAKNEYIPSSLINLLGIDLSFIGDGLITRFDSKNIIKYLKNYELSNFNCDLKSILQLSHVLTTKNCKEWSWEIINLLLTTILWQEKAFDETVKTTKFFKRLLSIYNPNEIKHNSGGVNEEDDEENDNESIYYQLSLLFSNIKKKDKKLIENYILNGIELIKLMLNKENGVEILKMSMIFEGLFKQVLDFLNNNKNNDKKEYLLNNEYEVGCIKMICLFTSNVQGINIIEKTGFVENLIKIGFTKIDGGFNKEEEIVCLFIRFLDLKISGLIRVLFGKWISIGTYKVRMKCIQRIENLMLNNDDDNDIFKDYTLFQWSITILMRQIYNSYYEKDIKIRAEKVVSKVVDKYGERALTAVLNTKPDLSICIDGPLIKSILKHRIGVEYFCSKWSDIVENCVLNYCTTTNDENNDTTSKEQNGTSTNHCNINMNNSNNNVDRERFYFLDIINYNEVNNSKQEDLESENYHYYYKNKNKNSIKLFNLYSALDKSSYGQKAMKRYKLV